MDVIIAARLSRKQKDGQEGIGLDTQDSRSTAFCERNDHNVVAVVADTKSGTIPPRERPNLKPWLTDPELMAQYQGIVAYKTDRLSRGKDEDFSVIEAWASANGKKLIIVNDADGIYYPSRSDSDYWQWVTEKRTARKEWENIQERNVRANTELRSRGMLANRYPWGYESAGEKYRKTIRPTEVCRTYAPQIFQRVIDGEAYDSIAEWLDSEGVKTANGGTWSGAHIGRLIKNETYKGRFKTRDGKLLFTCDKVVDADVWRDANQAAAERPKRGTPKPKAMLTGALYCLRCGARMNRHSGGRVSSRTISYRCTGLGIGINRKSCGMMISLALLEAIIDQRLSSRTDTVKRYETILGHDWSAELEEVRDEIRDLAELDLPDDEYDTRLSELRAKRDDYKSRGVTDPQSVEIDTGVSYAEMWSTLSDPERGQWLRNAKVKIYAMKGTQDEVDAIAAKSGMFTEDDAPPEVVDGVAIFIPMTLGFPLAKTTYRGEGE